MNASDRRAIRTVLDLVSTHVDLTPAELDAMSRLERLAAAGRITSRPLRAQSEKRRQESPIRAEVRSAVLARDGGCVGPLRGLRGMCGSVGDRVGFEVHEVAARSTTPGSHLIPDLAVVLCPRHHDMVTSPHGEDRRRAIEAGLLVRSWEVPE